MPVQLAARLRRSHLLFLGYAVDDWSLRVFLRRVWGQRPARVPLVGGAAVRGGGRRASSGTSAASRCTTSRSRRTPEQLARLTAALAAWTRRDELGLPPDGPYKGLARFGDSELDGQFFFGREREIELVAANLMASRLTRALRPERRREELAAARRRRAAAAGARSRRRRRRRRTAAAGRRGRPWRDDPLLAIAVAAGAARTRVAEELADVLAERVAERGGELYLVLDQMEEYVVYHGRDRVARSATRSRRS